ncbi:MAG: hypothetical protein ACK5P4_03290, partial [Bacteroidota bacterium]
IKGRAIRCISQWNFNKSWETKSATTKFHWEDAAAVPCAIKTSSFNFIIPCSLFIIQFQHSLFLFIIQIQHSLFLVPCSLFNFNIPCSLFIIQFQLNSQAGGQMVSSLAGLEQEHRLRGHKRWTYSTFIIQLQHSLFLVHYSI